MPISININNQDIENQKSIKKDKPKPEPKVAAKIDSKSNVPKVL